MAARPIADRLAALPCAGRTVAPLSGGRMAAQPIARREAVTTAAGTDPTTRGPGLRQERPSVQPRVIDRRPTMLRQRSWPHRHAAAILIRLVSRWIRSGGAF
jgi:hypothetical protein